MYCAGISPRKPYIRGNILLLKDPNDRTSIRTRSGCRCRNLCWSSSWYALTDSRVLWRTPYASISPDTLRKSKFSLCDYISQARVPDLAWRSRQGCRSTRYPLIAKWLGLCTLRPRVDHRQSRDPPLWNTRDRNFAPPFSSDFYLALISMSCGKPWFQRARCASRS